MMLLTDRAEGGDIYEDLYDQFDAIAKDENMTDLLIGIIRTHVAEIYSPPRITELAKEFDMLPGFALDITVNDYDGKPWDFDNMMMRKRCKNKIRTERPHLLVGSPMCTVFSALMNLNKDRMGPAKWEAMWAWGMRHLLFAIECYELQISLGGYILHEHPQSATSWHVPEMVEFVAKHNLERLNAHMCCFGLQSSDDGGVGPVKKPTGFITNSKIIRDELSRKCDGLHRHVHLVGGRAKAAQVYPHNFAERCSMD